MNYKSKLLALSGIALFALSCGSKENKNDKTELADLKAKEKEIQAKIAALELKNPSTDSARKIPVLITEMNTESFSNYIDVQGKVDLDEVVTAIPEVPGIINSILVKQGQHVTKGQVVATLRSETVDRGIDQLDQQIAFAKTLYDKQKRLWDQEIGTEIQLLSAKNNYEALLKQKQTTLSNKNSFTVVSPIDGIVDAVNASVGQSYASPVNPPIIRIINTGKLRVKADIPENYASWVKTGSIARLLFADIKDSLNTRVAYAEKVINPMSRTFAVYIPLPSHQKYQPNMAVQVKIATYNNAHAFVLPVSLIQKTDNGEFVYVADNDNRARLIPVRLGNTYNNKVEILSGIAQGQKVISGGYEELNEGDFLEIGN
jgi:membrane fusion protein (multidrug efflux system)